VVKGELRTYRIHLGSGNILMEPNDQYLCRRRAAEASTRLARIGWRLAGVNRAGRRPREGGDPVSLFGGSTCPSQPIAPA
jgi:hypothetical protein